MREKKILALSGGPHEGGTTAAMLERAVCAAKKAGFQVENINLYQQNIAYCKGCRAAEEFFKTAGMKCAGKFVCAGTGGNQTPSKKLLGKLERAVERL